MKKIYMISFIFVVLFVSSNVFATVGGPTFLHTFKYNPSNESVYYIKEDSGGRGCPPELFKLSLNTNKSQVVYSCDQGENLVAEDKFSAVNIEINKITNGFKNLIPINLKDNRISIDVSFVNYEKLTPEIDEIKNANFTASIYQDGKKITDLPIMGCNLQQPFLFAGYAVPGFEKKIVLLLSTKGDCFEGGYIDETLYVVGGVNNLDKTFHYNSFKDSSALVPSEATLVVFESEKTSKEVEKDVDSGSSDLNNDNNNVDSTDNQVSDKQNLYLILTFLVALSLGYFMARRKSA